jgi:hypothetical protein
MVAKPLIRSVSCLPLLQPKAAPLTIRRVMRGWVQGAWEADLPHGQGTRVTADGAVYTGLHVRGQYHGAGVLLAADGTRFEGVWEEGVMKRQGTIRWKNGNG